MSNISVRDAHELLKLNVEQPIAANRRRTSWFAWATSAKIDPAARWKTEKLMPITVLRHRGRPRGESARSFRSAAEWVEVRSSGKTPTLKPHGTADNELPDNSNAKPQRSKVSFAGKCRRSGKQASPYSSTEKTSVWLARSSSSCSAAISSATAR